VSVVLGIALEALGLAGMIVLAAMEFRGAVAKIRALPADDAAGDAAELQGLPA